MSTLSKRIAFTRALSGLIQKAFDLGFEATIGEVYRPPETASLYAKQGKGAIDSKHISGLAVDINLYKRAPDGTLKYITETEQHRPLGEWWKSIGGTWGGDFKRKDGNHYEWS